MKFITKKAIDNLNDEYYEGRYDYFKEVIDQIKLMDNINTTLEIGPYKSPLVEGGDVIDIKDNDLKSYPIKIGKFYKHDCSVTPYPLKDKQYDLVIACQVLEHLGTNQKEIFKELSRISKKAIITLPYKWNVPCNKHHMIDENVIDYWAQGLKPTFEKIFLDRPQRILRIYNFDDDITSLEYNKKLQEHANFQVLNKLEQEKKERKEIEEELDSKNRILLNKLEQEKKERKEIEKKLDNKNKILLEMLDSNSWKLTKPLRKLRTRFK